MIKLSYLNNQYLLLKITSILLLKITPNKSPCKMLQNSLYYSTDIISRSCHICNNTSLCSYQISPSSDSSIPKKNKNKIIIAPY